MHDKLTILEFEVRNMEYCSFIKVTVITVLFTTFGKENI